MSSSGDPNALITCPACQGAGVQSHYGQQSPCAWCSSTGRLSRTNAERYTEWAEREYAANMRNRNR
jgi:DnaJ-class molecular chaperone